MFNMAKPRDLEKAEAASKRGLISRFPFDYDTTWRLQQSVASHFSHVYCTVPSAPSTVHLATYSFQGSSE
jgi:hypothetical protein